MAFGGTALGNIVILPRLSSISEPKTGGTRIVLRLGRIRGLLWECHPVL